MVGTTLRGEREDTGRHMDGWSHILDMDPRDAACPTPPICHVHRTPSFFPFLLLERQAPFCPALSVDIALRAMCIKQNRSTWFDPDWLRPCCVTGARIGDMSVL